MHRIILIMWLALWGKGLFATTFTLPGPTSRIVGHNLLVFSQKEDTLLDIARRFDIGYREIVNANPNIDPWLPGENQPVLVPNKFILPDAPHKGIVINLAEMRLYYYPKVKKGQPQQVITHPIGIGREGWATPLGQAKIIQKIKDPSWTPPESIREEHQKKGDPLPKVVPAGPDNPLGAYAMRLSIPGYLVHGTNKPFGVGMRVSHGCIRLFPEDIAHLFGIVAVNTPVNIVYQPYKAALDAKGRLYLEAHEPDEDMSQNQGNNMTPMVKAILGAQNRILPDEDWPFAEDVVRQHTGVVVGLNQRWDATLVKNVWFLHAGLAPDSKKKLSRALTELDLNDYFWPMRDAAHEELLVGPFNTQAKAKQIRKQLSAMLDIPVWPVNMTGEAL